MSARQHDVSTGIAGLDAILDGLRIGDNVVWRLRDINDYQSLANAFVEAGVASGRRIIYLRFGQHPPLLAEGRHVQRVNINALGGFEAFTSQVWQLIRQHGRGAYYVCDCLSDLLNAWATDHMVGNFFRVVCPLLYRLDTVAYFALHPDRHSAITLSRIRDTTQVMIDLHRADNEVQIQPIKVWQRESPTMFLPHRRQDDRFIPVTDSSDATRLQAQLEQHGVQPRADRAMDCWDRMFMSATEALASGDPQAQADSKRQILAVMIGREAAMLALAERHFALPDLLAIGVRLIGSGFIGGKAVGMLLARQILLQHDPACWQTRLEPHDSFHIGSDVFYAYLVHNDCWPSLMRQRSMAGYFDEAPALRQRILDGDMPQEIRLELQRVLDHFGQYPILVRSSSLQEDSFGSAFAGKYDSVFLVNQGSPETRLAQLEQAIRQVYASAMNTDALLYRQQRGLATQEEPMALLLQRVNGRYHRHYYLPDAAAVGVSRNTFVWHRDMDPSAGMLRLVMGLGTRAVDRIEDDHACVMALDHPRLRPFRNQQERDRFSQHLVDVLNIRDNALQTLPLRTLVTDTDDLPLATLGECDQEATRRARELGDARPVWRLNFEPLIRDSDFIPLARGMLDTLESAYRHPVDIEFTIHLDGRGSPSINLVQCRPLATHGLSHQVETPGQIPAHNLLFETCGNFMGAGGELHPSHVVYVEPARYARLGQPQRHALSTLIGELCRALPQAARILLIGPGRWGTSSPELGIPVRYADISRVSVLVEVADLGNGLVPDLSFGSHFFQDLVESDITYVALFPSDPGCRYQPQWLSSRPATPLEAWLDRAMFDEAVLAAVSLYAVGDARLRLVADILQQRLVCYQA